MWLIKLIKKLFFLILFLIVVSIMAVVFIGSLWYQNVYDHTLWQQMIASATAPSGAITNLAPNIGPWFSDTIKNASEISRTSLHYLIPGGFAVVFGIIIYTLLSLTIGLSWKLAKRAKKRNQVQS